METLRWGPKGNRLSWNEPVCSSGGSGRLQRESQTCRESNEAVFKVACANFVCVLESDSSFVFVLAQ